ncbi:hypothetical protein [Sulfuriroseicoccus oceanibius]|uniref:DUF4412 domain-containing protein n=1 Tax=Sulfuriroseicoccus oceanibius TaxID=2707525 RepID=A0A6B3L8B9_9BACT|nr:hypothetical protein [Sulfuriroseicoccus oceanibius]QQL44914.1 hypothetical protein G3M56_013765 [Sulfuriroseicoccus oceanibius]
MKNLLKKTALTALLLSTLSGAQAAESYPLHQLDYTLPTGTVVTTEYTGHCDEMKIRFQNGNQARTGAGSLHQHSETIDRTLGPSEREIEVTENQTNRALTINGIPMPSRPEIDPLRGVKMLAVKVGNRWQLKFQPNAEPTSEQKTKLKQKEASMNAKRWHYSLVPRHVGETWQGDMDMLKSISGLDRDIKGEMTITFSKLTEYHGQKCAVLDFTFQVTGKNDEGATMVLKGQGSSTRSLIHFIDLKRDSKVTSTMTRTEGARSLTMDMPTSLSTRTTITRPNEPENGESPQ